MSPEGELLTWCSTWQRVSTCQPGALLEAEPVVETATAATAVKAEKIYGFELKVNKMCDKAHQVRQ